MFAVLTDSKTLSERIAAVARVPSLLLSGAPLRVGKIALGTVVFVFDPEVDLDSTALPPAAVFRQYQSLIKAAALHLVPFGTFEQRNSVESHADQHSLRPCILRVNPLKVEIKPPPNLALILESPGDILNRTRV
jgi:hypothetical protein